jgi:hypothetical protein
MNLKSLEENKKKSYFNLLNATDYFKRMMRDYIYQTQKSRKYIDIYTLLTNYRNQKIREISENDILKDEVGEEIRKLQEFKPNIIGRKLSIQEKNEISKSKNKLKKRENRISFLISIEKYQKNEKKNHHHHQHLNTFRYFNTNELNPEKMIFHRRVFSDNRNNLKTKRTLLSHNSTKTFSDFDTIQSTNTNLLTTRNKIYRDQINYLSTDILHDSSNIKKNYSNSIKTLNYDYDEWKKKIKIKFPNISQGFKTYNV